MVGFVCLLFISVVYRGLLTASTCANCYYFNKCVLLDTIYMYWQEFTCVVGTGEGEGGGKERERGGKEREREMRGKERERERRGRGIMICLCVDLT